MVKNVLKKTWLKMRKLMIRIYAQTPIQHDGNLRIVFLANALKIFGEHTHKNVFFCSSHQILITPSRAVKCFNWHFESRDHVCID